MSKQYYVYIAANRSNSILYTGMTNNLVKRMYEHKNKLIDGFTSKYNVNKLLYYQVFGKPIEAILAEKKIKGWVRRKKIDLIKNFNPGFNDLIIQTDSSLRSE